MYTIGYKYESGRDSDYLFYNYSYFEPCTTWPGGLVVSVSGYKTRGRVGTYFQCVFSSFFNILMLNYFILVKAIIKMTEMVNPGLFV